GYTSSVYRFPETITEKELLETLDFLKNDPEVDGYIVQLPLPKHISERKVLESINPAKDVDGFHPTNEGRMMIGLPSYIPATPYGIKKLLDRSNIETEGKHCVVLGRSNIVGTPISILMSRNSSKANCTVTMCHSKTKNLKEICLQADIIIVAIGKPEFLTADMVKEGAVIVDVGIHRIPADNEKGYKIIGDVKYDEVAPKCKAITPVPGGVGPMTIVALLDNTLKAYKHEIYE
ncbi:MAG: bifunctional 5,10-methylene-tetrahydrofolate dehydrogenase/5,10-methylene-tetrahydrofolate cyclohydrolase, partial [Bacteroidales bacterium]|nr:bifunctional 5,10-methylene-tetrahydrofolate dehydrogenase/5,10-methylene-tetrahydrofolate cyclohydrolase [Bacteroidales bacterium]